MVQVAEVEQFEEKKMFLGLNNMDSCREKACFHVIADYDYRNGEKKVSSGTEDSFSLLFPNF